MSHFHPNTAIQIALESLSACLKGASYGHTIYLEFTAITA
jgi:hypothetical protein